MTNIRNNSKLLAVLLLLVLSLVVCKKSTMREILDATLNNKFKQIQQDHADQIEKEMAIERVVDPDLLAFKDKVMTSIMQKGHDQNQITQALKGGVTSAKDLTVNTAFVDANTNLVDSHTGGSFLSLKVYIPSSDDPSYFFADEPYTRNINSIPQTGQSPITPWSSTYWATRNGGISVRYCMNNKSTIGSINANGGYSAYYSWYQSVSKYHQPAEHNIYSTQSGSASYVDNYYSPGEKYDLAMGDYSYAMTNWAKNDGRAYVKNGDVPSWYGICHGWSPAAFVFKRPYKAVTITGAGGVQIRFLPDDIKALASQFMANATYKTRWIGNRCRFYPNTSGWYTDPYCRSLNPGSFLITIGNWIGINGNNFVLDPQADPEIWNQPVKGYQMRYYNVMTSNFYSTASAAAVSARNVNYCGTSWCRNISHGMSSGTASVVGVFMRVTYTQETNAIHTTTTRPDSMKTDSYDGAVELDTYGNIIGGKWKDTKYPNFVWRPDQKLPIEGINDHFVTTWDGSEAGLAGMTQYAKSASVKGQPMKAFVQYLVDNSS